MTPYINKLQMAITTLQQATTDLVFANQEFQFAAKRLLSDYEYPDGIVRLMDKDRAYEEAEDNSTT